jgi:hypothetical protein
MDRRVSARYEFGNSKRQSKKAGTNSNRSNVNGEGWDGNSKPKRRDAARGMGEGLKMGSF